MKHVIMRIITNKNPTMAIVPTNAFEKTSTLIVNAIVMRMALSPVPKLFLIQKRLENYIRKKQKTECEVESFLLTKHYT